LFTYVVEFLLFRQHGKEIYLVTNAYSKTLLKCKDLSGPTYIVSYMTLDSPKIRFWLNSVKGPVTHCNVL
jgi:hypothetical protein